MLGEINDTIHIKFSIPNYKNPNMLLPIYLTIKKAISVKIPEDCSLNNSKLICVAI